jgi:hypothetical protein
MRFSFALVFITLFTYHPAIAQQDAGELHGNFQTDFQLYRKDEKIGAPIVPEKFRINAFSNIVYTRKNFFAGLRYEAYQNALLGFDQRYNGQGIPFRYAGYETNGFTITLGNFYEQYGSGLLLRAYEERGLGYDNAFDGLRVHYRGIKGLTLKGLVGRQRVFFSSSKGIVRAFDGEVSLNELIPGRQEKTVNLIAGAGIVSKYEPDESSTLRLPANVGCSGGRLKLVTPRLTVSAEYVFKINDPSYVNSYIYKNGTGLLFNASYAQKGFGFTLSAKRIDNMNFRSERDAVNNNLMINFLPALTRQHTYNLVATLYPYATQPTGEMGLPGDLTYTFKKGSWLGGNNGMTLLVNYANAYAIDQTPTGDGYGYTSNPFKVGKELYYQDLNIEVNKKINKRWKMNLLYANIAFNGRVVAGVTQKPETVHANIAVVDITHKFNSKHALRMEAQTLFTRQDRGNWVTFLAEYTVSPNWFFAALNQYNIGNPDAAARLNYPFVTVGYVKESTRISISYGRQRAGIFCVGGVCRQVPASSGLSVTISTSF